MPDGMPDGPVPSTAPPVGGQPPPGAVQSGGAGGPETTGILPPTGGAGALDGKVPAPGIQAMGRQAMRFAMGLLHFSRYALDPFTEEGKAVEKMYGTGLKHFKADQETSKTGQAPTLAQMGGGQPPMGGSPQMAPGAPGMPQPPSGPIPRLTGANM